MDVQTETERFEASTSVTPLMGQWNHICATFNGTSLTIFIDGQVYSQSLIKLNNYIY